MRLLVYNVRHCVVPFNFNTEYSLSQRYNRVRLHLIQGAWVYRGANYSLPIMLSIKCPIVSQNRTYKLQHHNLATFFLP